ncbi:hypothetical protein C8F01DRAFT_1243428 [Mycena amicta]|nr:hypothetical protein C8F01DRAFT_1243428 [Mycena amicta]
MDGSVPLSFPAILRNPAAIPALYAHLADTPIPKKAKSSRRDNEGKRWVRRKENARFTGNTHVVQPNRVDLAGPQVPQIRTTFAEPLTARDIRLPNFKGHAAQLTGHELPFQGAFIPTLPSPCLTCPQTLVGDIEIAIVGWLAAGGTILFPDDGNTRDFRGTLVGNTGIIELSRTALQLVWRASTGNDLDPFIRYVIHCTARYHKVISYSKEVSGERLTYLLRPNVTMPEFWANAGLDTPPATDVDISSQHDSESEFSSDRDGRSEVGDVERMFTIQEDAVSVPTDDEWSVVGDEESALTQSIESLDPDATLVVERRFAGMSLRSRASLPHTRSTSSPSRSPVRPQRRLPLRPALPRQTPMSFYDYLFS